MRVLNFIVNGDKITRDPNCDFTGLFPGKEKEVMAEFEFSSEWDDLVKVAAFWSITGVEYPPQEIFNGTGCLIPIEALQRPAFKIQILGKGRKKYKETAKLTIYQRGGKV